jgi:hypothetical protein
VVPRHGHAVAGARRPGTDCRVNDHAERCMEPGWIGERAPRRSSGMKGPEAGRWAAASRVSTIESRRGCWTDRADPISIAQSPGDLLMRNLVDLGKLGARRRPAIRRTPAPRLDEGNGARAAPDGRSRMPPDGRASTDLDPSAATSADSPPPGGIARPFGPAIGGRPAGPADAGCARTPIGRREHGRPTDGADDRARRRGR